eukprot:m.64724 g.64724  ORF g.64724 m.64724 type:complete len:65 (+) comp8123_c0_seq3:368-562(+)
MGKICPDNETKLGETSFQKYKSSINVEYVCMHYNALPNTCSKNRMALNVIRLVFKIKTIVLHFE